MTKSVTVTLGDENFEIRAFNIGEVEEMIELLERMTTGTNRERFVATQDVLCLALRQNKPETTSADVKKIIATTEDVRRVVDEVLKISGFVKPAPGEAEAGAV